MNIHPFQLDQISAWGLVPIILNHGDNLIGCELGVCRGHNLRYLLDRAKNISKSYAIDPYIPYVDPPWGLISQEEVHGWRSIAKEILAPFHNKVQWIESTSIEASQNIPDEELDYIFIDGDHTYPAVYADLHAYWNKLKPGGIWAGHDWNLEGVNQAVTKFRLEKNITTQIQFTESNVWYWYK